MIRKISDPELRAAVVAAYEAWRRWRDRETGQLEIPFEKGQPA